MIAVTPKIETLLEDYECVTVPKSLSNTFVGHTYNVKCVKFLGEDGRLMASGSSDRTIMLWRVQEDLDSDTSDDEEDPKKGSDVVREVKQRGPERIILGHKSRIWDIASDRSGRWLASASGDSTVRLWDVWSCLEQNPEHNDKLQKKNTIRSGAKPIYHADGESQLNFESLPTGHEGDIYSLEFDNNQENVVTAGYDKSIRLMNIQQNKLVKVFKGHSSAVTHVKFNPIGNLVVSASKDSTIRFWDTVSGVCVRTLTQPISEITSIDISRDGLQLLSNSKDGTIRLWDVRTGRSFRRFRGHQNSSLNFIRSVYGPREALIFGGSEDGKVHIWDKETGNLLARLRGHTGPVFHTVWNTAQSLLASCSEDGTVRTWRA